MHIDPESPSSLHAVRELVGLSVMREDTVMLTTARFWATADEMHELTETLHRLTERFAGRNARYQACLDEHRTQGLANRLGGL